MNIRLALAVVAALFAVIAPSATAVPPDVQGNQSLWLVSGAQLIAIPPAEPKVGDTIESTWAVFHCDPSCDPNNPDSDPTVGNREIRPTDSGPPAGFTMAWERCDKADATGCIVVRPKTAQGVAGAERYKLTDADAGKFIRSAVYGTNLDCGYPRSYDQHQDCAWRTSGVYSALLAVPATVALNPATLPDGQAGVPYRAAITASNGTGPYAYSIVGALPPGLNFTGGAVQGTPTLAGTYTFTIGAAGAGANPGSRTYTMRIGLSFAQTPFAGGTTGIAYSAPLSIIGANGAVSWTVTTGVLPTGLTIANNTLAGTPTQKGTFSFTLLATDAAGNTATTTPYSLDIVWPVLHGSPTRLPKATVGLRYRTTLNITGGNSPYSFAITAGRLPRGLTLNAAGTLSGKAKEKTKKLSFRFVALVTDRYGAQTPIMFVLPYKGKAR